MSQVLISLLLNASRISHLPMSLATSLVYHIVSHLNFSSLSTGLPVSTLGNPKPSLHIILKCEADHIPSLKHFLSQVNKNLNAFLHLLILLALALAYCSSIIVQQWLSGLLCPCHIFLPWPLLFAIHFIIVFTRLAPSNYLILSLNIYSSKRFFHISTHSYLLFSFIFSFFISFYFSFFFLASTTIYWDLFNQ